MCSGYLREIEIEKEKDIYIYHRRRLANLDKILGPLIGLVPKCSIFHGFSYETCRKKLVEILNVNYNS
jgi:hypothetical protein